MVKRTTKNPKSTPGIDCMREAVITAIELITKAQRKVSKGLFSISFRLIRASIMLLSDNDNQLLVVVIPPYCIGGDPLNSLLQQ